MLEGEQMTSVARTPRLSSWSLAGLVTAIRLLTRRSPECRDCSTL